MARLPQLLRYFKLAPTASTAELRKAYLTKVKECHPDACGASCSEFLEVQNLFKEANELLALQPPPCSGPAPVMSWGRASDCRGGSQPFAEPITVPVVGLSERTVYPFAAAFSFFAVGATSYVLTQQRRPSPVAAENHKVPVSLGDGPSGVDLGRAKYPPLEHGPWNVALAKAVVPGKGLWSPSRSWEFVDSGSFYASRAKGHNREGIGQRVRLGEKQGGQVKVLSYEASHQPQVRRGTEMLPVHAAAEDANLWFLEQCGATPTCRAMLNLGDVLADTPLHHAAWAGRADSCLVLLRLGADTDARNADGLMPEEVAGNAGHAEVAELLRSARLAAEGTGTGPAPRHPDGLGIMAQPPDDVVFVGLKASESLRHAVNMASGYNVAPPLPVNRSMKDSENAAVRIAGVVRGALQDTEFDLEDPLPQGLQAAADFWAAPLGKEPNPGVEACGLLLYEAPNEASQDAPGHWVAVRRSSTPEEYWRLDPVRGPFRLTAPELEALVCRYQAWRVIRGSQQLRQLRTAKLHATSAEAQALVH
ncbi:unnamed protein product [Polarella glacialis]|uniref:Uncharacterized protein n=1 Tax=Polarella glacialis TaxID=89957 RepID=A0A813FV57_POLGL|nr:unnamed protein product [Polarella glacialis]